MKLRPEDYEDFIEDDELDGDHISTTSTNQKKMAKKEFEQIRQEAADKISKLQARESKVYKRIDRK